jgi:hypothetical protein
MSLFQIITSIALILAFTLPVIFLIIKHKNKGKRLINQFDKLAENNHLKITNKEKWNSYYCIGIDTESQKVLYLNLRGDKQDYSIIDLNDIIKCKTNKLSRSIKTNSGNIFTIDKLELTFINKNNSIPDKNLQFYFGEDDVTLNHELLIVEKWEKIVNENLKKFSN